jgi:hypothetical protein
MQRLGRRNQNKESIVAENEVSKCEAPSRATPKIDSIVTLSNKQKGPRGTSRVGETIPAGSGAQ